MGVTRQLSTMQDGLLYCLLVLSACSALHVGKFLSPSLSVRNWDDSLVGMDSLIITNQIRKWRKGVRSKEEKVKDQKKHEMLKRKKKNNEWEKFMHDKSVYNSLN